jgi:hypothetical protein
MNGNVEPIWSPTTVADTAAVTNEDEPSAATDASTTTTMPITWNTNWDDVVYDLRGDEELYAYFLANFGGCVAGVLEWNFNALSGAKVMSVSMEALLLLFLLNYVKVWESQQLEQQQSEESSAAGRSVSSVSMTSVTM